MRELARVAGVSPVLLSRIRSGDREATPEVAERLVKAMAVLARQRAAEEVEYGGLAEIVRHALPKGPTH